MNLSKILFTTFVCCLLLTTSHCQTRHSTYKEKLETYLNTIHTKKGFNGEILVAKEENILFQQTIGLASHENNLSLKNGAKYRIASITKTFTGTLIAIAQEESKLNVYDKAIDYINGLSPKFKDITIEQLLRHTSGLPHNEGIKDYWGKKSKLQLTHGQVMEEINTLDLLSKPGSKMHYSSLGYYLLASILENVYKNNFEKILEEKILNKLHMNETGVANDLQSIAEMASGYHLVTDDSLVIAPYRNYSMLKGAGDMYSATTDLLKWTNSFFSNKLLNDKTKAKMFNPYIKKKSNYYSYGWYMTSDSPIKQYHGGGTWGYSTHIAMYPKEQLSIIILSNISKLPISDIASDIEKIVFNQPFEMPIIQKATKKSINLGIYDGNYISETSEMILVIKKIENSLYAKLGSNPPFEIYPKGNHQFFGKKIEVEFSFETINDSIVGVSAKRMGKTFNFTKQSN